MTLALAALIVLAYFPSTSVENGQSDAHSEAGVTGATTDVCVCECPGDFN